MALDARSFLASRSVSETQVAEAEAGGWLPLLVVDQLLFPGAPTYTAEDVAAKAGVDRDLATRLWRAMGNTDIDDEAYFYDEDVDALRVAAAERAAGTPEESIIRQTRLVSSAISRIAESVSEDVAARLAAMREAGRSDDEMAQWLRTTVDLDQSEKLLGYFLRRQLRSALWRKLAVPGSRLGDHTLTVGFVDLVRFTAIIEDVAEEELDALVTRFDEVAHDRITRGGGRMVKMIGDEVMFVSDDLVRGVTIALDLVDAYALDETLPRARAGLSRGGVLARDGDYFGPVVNLASRIVDVARPNSVVISESVHDELRDYPGLLFRRLPPKRLKGIGRPPLWSVRRDS